MGKSKRDPPPVETDKIWYRSLNGIVKLDPVCCSESKCILMDLSAIKEEEEEREEEQEEEDIHLQREEELEQDEEREEEQDEDEDEEQGQEQDGRYPIDLHVTRDVLYLVNRYCVLRYRIRERFRDEDIHLQLKALWDFDNNFVKDMKPNLLVRLHDAAVELEIKSLFDITYKTIVDKTTSMDDLLKIFNLPDFSHQLWKDPLVREVWDDLNQYDLNNNVPSTVPIKRPDHGGIAGLRAVTLLANHFPVTFDPSKSILRYDVDVKHKVKQEASSSSTRPMKKSISKSDLRLILQKLFSTYPEKFPECKTAYDGEKNIYSAVFLVPGTYTVELCGQTYLWTIKYGNELSLSKLQEFLDGNAMQVPHDVLHALDVVTNINLIQEEKVSVGGRFYPPTYDLHCGVAVHRGSHKSLKVTSSGLVICSDYSAIPIRKRMCVLDFLKEFISDIRHINDIPRLGKEVVSALRGLRVSVTHRPTRQKYIVSGLTEKLTKDLSFELEDVEGNKEPKVVMLIDYFREKWGKEIQHKGIPCLTLGSSNKPNYIPMEFCVLADDRRFPKEQLGMEAARKLEDLCLLAPNERVEMMEKMCIEDYAAGRPGFALHKFGLSVGPNMTRVIGRVLEPPRLKGALRQGKTLVMGKAAQRWALIDFTTGGDCNQHIVTSFISKLMQRCKSMGVQMEQPLLMYSANMRVFFSKDDIFDLLRYVVQTCGKANEDRLQIIVCVMADKHVGYKYLKWISETKVGVMTQCCLSRNAYKATDKFLVNLCMKINVKLGGSNVELVGRFPCFSDIDHFMFIGVYVNHSLAPSIAATVGSMNWPASTRYAARISEQHHRGENISNFGSMCLELVNAYAKHNGVKPNKIVVFRDGVSDGQFDKVFSKEIYAMKQAICTETYCPSVTFVVAQKRHTTRLFPDPWIENVPSGTVVDTGIVHPIHFDFYVCSHFVVGRGTSKPTHYTVICDEIRFTSDEMQKLIYDLCHMFARCTKPVSVVTPVYYAELGANRGLMFREVAKEAEPVLEALAFKEDIYGLEDHLKDSMFFI